MVSRLESQLLGIDQRNRKLDRRRQARSARRFHGEMGEMDGYRTHPRRRRRV